MIKEDYISFETAKLLKEKGFYADTDHDMWYVVEKFSTGCHWNSCTYKVGDITREYDEKYCIAMPTLQMVMKWMREVYNICISVDVKIGGGKYYVCISSTENGLSYGVLEDEVWDTFEEACEESIKYCLENLINK